MKVFLDANILFTACHNPKGKSASLIRNTELFGVRLFTCEYAVVEARRTLERKFQQGLPVLEKFLIEMEVLPTKHGHCPINLPEKDRPIFLSAHHAHCTHLLTGDLRDFGEHMNRPEKTSGIIIQTVAEFLQSVK